MRLSLMNKIDVALLNKNTPGKHVWPFIAARLAAQMKDSTITSRRCYRERGCCMHLRR